MALFKIIKAWLDGLPYLFKSEPSCYERRISEKKYPSITDEIFRVPGEFYINEKAVSAFNRLVYTYDLDEKFDFVAPLDEEQKIYLYKREYDYLSFLINRNEGKILSEEEVSELNEIIENGEKEKFSDVFGNEICDEK